MRVETAFPGTRKTRILDGATVWRGNDGALQPAAGQADAGAPAANAAGAAAAAKDERHVGTVLLAKTAGGYPG